MNPENIGQNTFFYKVKTDFLIKICNEMNNFKAGDVEKQYFRSHKLSIMNNRNKRIVPSQFGC